MARTVRMDFRVQPEQLISIEDRVARLEQRACRGAEYATQGGVR